MFAQRFQTGPKIVYKNIRTVQTSFSYYFKHGEERLYFRGIRFIYF